MSMRICELPSCQQEYAPSKHPAAASQQRYCSTVCQTRACHERWITSNPEGYAEAHRRNYQERRAAITEAKKAPCKDCGQTYPSYVMDFDHVRGQKCFDIGNSTRYALGVIYAEMDKCDLVCANC